MSNNSRVKVIHNVAKGPKVEVIIDGKIILSEVPYKTISHYLSVPTGKHHVAIAAGESIIAQAMVNLKPNTDYTVIAHGNIKNLKSIALLPLEDNNSCPKPGKAHVRFIHAAANIPNVDIWVNNNTNIFDNVAYGKTGNPVYLPVNAGDINIEVTPANKDTIVLGPIELTLEAGKIYSIIATGLLKDKDAPLDALLTVDSECHTVHTIY